MFVTKKRLDWMLKLRDESIRDLERKHWELRLKHNDLLSHLGLVEFAVPAKTELRRKYEYKPGGSGGQRMTKLENELLDLLAEIYTEFASGEDDWSDETFNRAIELLNKHRPTTLDKL